MNNSKPILKAVLIALGAVGTAQASTTAAITCASCQNINDLQVAAHNWVYQSTYVPSALIVTSLSAPITGIFHSHLVCAKRCIQAVVPDASTSTNAQAAQLDNLIYARSAKHERPVPITTQFSSIESTVSLQIESQLAPTGGAGMNPYHLLTGFPSITYYSYYDKVWNTPFDLYLGDMITVNYPGGFSEKFEFQGADKSPANRWLRVPHTLMLNGKPYSPPPYAPGTPIPGYSTTGGTNVWDYSNGRIVIGLDPQNCAGSSTVTVILDNSESVTGTGYFNFPC